MRRSTRSVQGHPTSPEPEMFHEHVERNTRSRVATEDLVILDLPRTTRNVRQPTSSEPETHKEPSERSTRARKVSGDPGTLELPRATRTGRRGSGKSPDAPKHSHRDGGNTSTESKHKPGKREQSPEGPVIEMSSKKRRRSGRLVDADSETCKTDLEENKTKVESQTKGLKHSQRHEDSLDSKNKHEQNHPEDSTLHSSIKKRRKSGHHSEKESEKDKHDKGEVEKKVDKKLKSSREKGKPNVKENADKDKQQNDSKHEHSNMKNQESFRKDQESKDSEVHPKDIVTSTRRRTRSGRFGADGEDEEEENHAGHLKSAQDDTAKATQSNNQDSKSGKDKESGKSSSRSVQGKGSMDNQRQLRSPEKGNKHETAAIDMQELEVDVTEKTAGKQSSKGPLSPPLRMSPRRARQPSGQKTQTTESVLEQKDASELQPLGETESKAASRNEKSKDQNSKESTSEPDIEQPVEVQKKVTTTRRDLFSVFNEIDNSQSSPSKQTNSRKEEHSGTTDDTATNQQKSPRGKKARSPVKSPRKDAAPVSPRKGLRSCKEPELDVTTVGDGVMGGGSDQENKVDVVAMETDAPGASCLLKPTLQLFSSEKAEGSQAEAQIFQAEIEQHQNLTEMPALDVPKEEDDVREIPDDVAAKIRDWRVEEEESLGFQGDDWYTEEVDEGEPFYFESDHMALKGNKDYRMLLRTITTLEAQRKQAIKDLDKLVTAQREALRNPLKFVHKLQKKDTLHLPSAQRIVLLPEMPWERYLGHADSKELIQGLSHQTRSSLKPRSSASDSRDSSQPSHPGMMAGPSAGHSAGLAEGEGIDYEKGKGVIRGRQWDETKPDTFNRLWTVEEQKRLESLLLKFPSEEVEARRWEKIAKELGNRTRHQVASRVQKYFIKLSKAGIPVPGRMPNMASYATKRAQKRSYINPFKNVTLGPSTFLQSIRAPVLMNEDDDALDYEFDYDADSIMEEDDVPPELKETEEFKELMRLKKLRNVTLKQESETSHVGYSCDGCGASPIVGVRWHCVNCPAEVSTDLCQHCVDEDYQSDVHSSSHRLDPIHTSQSGGFVDSDYTSFTGTSGDYNYLDPNYTPAVLG